MISPKNAAFVSVTMVHRGVLKLSGGRLLGNVASMPVIELTTKGRKSGRERTVVLTVPVRHEGNEVVVASKGGDPHSPGWYHNLVADPEVRVKAGPATQTRHARVATEAEREQLWPLITNAYKGYAGYQKKTARQIPLVILEPA